MKLASLLGVLLLSLTAHAKIPNFSEVKRNDIYRGGRPSTSDFRELKKDGIKMIISLERPNTVDKEKKLVEGLGMKFVSIPMSVYYAPTDKQMDTAMNLLRDSSNYPIFVHCLHGEDRTGLVMGLYRVEVDHWSAQNAYKEMLEMNFHPIYKPLDDYFKKRTQD